ncbi:hypothetical protein BEH94_07640 [Candidatus Altiarchaeales archaeon WOR_SM1_SCG]|nr:hypothetical protein BEH94_07640 [Candidatus Altiarchaeales archaeon WOR_SM1_SCG]
MNFIKYPKVKYLGDEEVADLTSDPEDEIVIQEKIDGANIRVLIHDGELVFGSRNVTMDDDMESSKMWNRAVSYVKEKLAGKDLSGLNNCILFMEYCIKHTMSYDWTVIPPVLGFDIYELSSGEFIDFRECKRLFNELEIDFVPVIDTIKAKDLNTFTDELVPVSAYSSPSAVDRQAEGVVFKNYNTQVFAKYVREKFKEQNKEAFGSNKKYAGDDTERLIAIYCTNPRIDKMIFYLRTESVMELNLKMMTKLPMLVLEDIIEENYREILISNYTVDFRKFRKLIAKRCLAVLKQVIVNSELTGL